MTPEQFVNKWQRIEAKERTIAQTHFNELCDLLGVPKPLDVDHTGDFYTYEKPVEKVTGGKGFADVWYKERFAWEYKGKRKDLVEAYRQLVAYREDLGNPPLLIVSDINTIKVRTNFTGIYPSDEIFSLQDLLDNNKRSRLKKVWTDPQAFNPQTIRVNVTEATVKDLLVNVADKLKARGYDADKTAHFLVKVVFTLFAEDADLLPSNLFTQLLNAARKKPKDFKPMAEQLFSLMSKGGVSIIGSVPYFNGEVFSDNEAPELTLSEISYLAGAASQDWTAIEPSIFGTLFERAIDPDKRAKLGAHYTPRTDILDVVEPVIFEPLYKEWEDLRSELEPLTKTFFKEDEQTGKQANLYDTPLGSSAKDEAISKLETFLDRLSTITVLDPACGSGNFLYMTMQRLMDLEFSVRSTIRLLEPGKAVATRITPKQFYGFEVNSYAHEIAGMVLWIGYLQWLRSHDETISQEPILQKLENLQNVDAVLDGEKPRAWPDVDYIVGNPPFLGNKKMRSELGNEYVEMLREAYSDKLPEGIDLVCYWFDRANEKVKAKQTKRVGLIATNSIRQSTNQIVLENIKKSGDIFIAWPDRPWIQDGAAVRVSVICFDDGAEKHKRLYNDVSNKKIYREVVSINADLTSGVDLIQTQTLMANINISFQGIKAVGPFDVPFEVANQWFDLPNPTAVSNRDVLKLYVNGNDITGKSSDRWIIDFAMMEQEEAKSYVIPYNYVETHVKPSREHVRRKSHKERWWRFGEARPAMREALEPLEKYIVTSEVAKHRVFTWLSKDALPAGSLIVIASESESDYGVLNSYPHVLWSLSLGSRLGVGNDSRYTPSTTFETFPFPHPTNEQREAISKAAQHLHNVREFLKKKDKTLTEIYNELEALRAQEKPNIKDPVYSLLLAHQDLDKAVYAAYGWEYPLTDEVILERLLALNLERATVGKQNNSDENSQTKDVAEIDNG
jgi:type II restriction/modification system DNA methylase subunit YeeA